MGGRAAPRRPTRRGAASRWSSATGASTCRRVIVILVPRSGPRCAPGRHERWSRAQRWRSRPLRAPGNLLGAWRGRPTSRPRSAKRWASAPRRSPLAGLGTSSQICYCPVTDWEIVYYSDDVQETIGAWPVGVRAYYARLTERMRVLGPNLGMPFTRSMGQGLFEMRARGKEGLGMARKSPKAPLRELEVARRRLADVQRRRVEGDRHEDSR